jgi:ATP-dependent helicase/nuclease subunit A
MTESYLDTSRSVIISSPAGSGKTEKLARRYVSLLDGGSAVEEVLCITFTEKAAAEMKHRILSILEKEYPELYEKTRAKVPLMRISTIHAFCLRLLKRFAVELGFDPSVSVADELAARELWTESVYECLREDGENSSGFFGVISKRGLRGWGSLLRALEEIHKKRPYPELLALEGERPEGEALSVFSLYARCLEKYSSKKLERRLVDFQDLELLAYRALSQGAEWQNILYAFDEHTDHLLVDEFQDTSTLQWMIIEKLTEEWRSGLGAKRDRGKTPTIFLVGDEKQSIYRFRGANVSVFNRAKENFGQWLGDEYHFVEVKENYRSLPAIVDFVNELFSRVMPGSDPGGLMTPYTPFQATREGRGSVDLVLLDEQEYTKDTRAREARVLARAIRQLHGRHEVYGEDEKKRPCSFGDMAVLIRNRTHLALFEDALRAEGIPFVILKGIGFYDAPEVAALRDLVSLMVDPEDSYGLFAVLRSPIFSIDTGALSRRLKGKGDSIEKLRSSATGKLKEAAELLARWAEESRGMPLSEFLEGALTESGAWSRFWEPQRHSNIKKFIGLVESFESAGLSRIEIREKLLRQRFASEVAKANINAEGMNAVRVLTVHAAKGLQFPMVFLPSLEENTSGRSGPVVVEDDGESVRLYYEEDSKERRRNEKFKVEAKKREEEEKRLFYVAITRARDYLMMLGSHHGKSPKGRLGWVAEAFDVFKRKGEMPLSVLTEEDLEARSEARGLEFGEPKGFVDVPAYTEPLAYVPSPDWQDVTGEVEAGPGHGEHWATVGRVMHKLFEELSKGQLQVRLITERAKLLLEREGMRDAALLDVVTEDVWKLKRVGLLDDIVFPARDSYAELPFVLERDGNIYKGRMDRLIIKAGRAKVYDYKCFPAREAEIPELVERYRFQMEAYREAAERLFGLDAKSYLIFTHLPRLVEV